MTTQDTWHAWTADMRLGWFHWCEEQRKLNPEFDHISPSIHIAEYQRICALRRLISGTSW